MDPAIPAAAAAPPPQHQDPKRLVLKNTMILMLGQLIGSPLTMVVAAVIGNYLGSAAYGAIYIAGTMTVLGFLFVDWGQGPVMAGEIARDRSRGGDLLGTSLVWRIVASGLVYLILAIWTSLEHHEAGFQMILFLISLQCLLVTLTSACLEAIRGLERTDISAYQNVLQPLLNLALVVPVLALFHGGVRATLLAQVVVFALILGYVWRARSQVGLKPLRFRAGMLRLFFKPGSAFLILNLAMALQPMIDAKMLQYLVPLEVVGWNAAARKLIGPLILPAAVLIGAMYPTLSRLYVQDRAAFTSTLRGALRGTLILAFPIALSCALFGDVGILLYGHKEYAGANANLVALSPYLFLLYFSMPLGSAILAAQRQRVWSLVQFICVAVSLALDPLLVPWFQTHYGNGGVGVCLAASISEVLVVICGVALIEKGTFDRGFFLALLRCMIAGAAMTAVAFAFRQLPDKLWKIPTLIPAALVALPTYGIVLWAVGGLQGQQMDQVRAMIRRKLKR
jgi:O-antigen/teichoic acid export membrane protein